MAVDIHNFVARNFRGPDLAGVDQARYQNALHRNQIDRLPQQNRAQDLAIEQADQGLKIGQMELDQAGQQNALGILGRGLSMVRDRASASQIIADPSFQSAAQALSLPPVQITDQDTDESVVAEAQALLQAINGQGKTRVQSTHVLEDGTIALVGSDGQITRTNEKARNDLRFVDYGGGTGAFDPRQGSVTPITSASQETAAAADKAGAEAWARAAATAGVDLQKEQVGRQGTLGVWRVARQGLIAGLSGTNTGPLAGRMPAVTAGQQIADGGVAAVAPVLKALFRSAGEGVFTDKDQELLLAMVPQRTDHPETITAKMQMIDSIIEAKLAAPTAMPGIPTAQPGGGSPAGSYGVPNDPLGIR